MTNQETKTQPKRRRLRLDYSADLKVYKCTARTCLRPACVLVIKASMIGQPFRCPMIQEQQKWKLVKTMNNAIDKVLYKEVTRGK